MVMISPYFSFQKEIIPFVAKAKTLQVYLRVKQKSTTTFGKKNISEHSKLHHLYIKEMVVPKSVGFFPLYFVILFGFADKHYTFIK